MKIFTCLSLPLFHFTSYLHNVQFGSTGDASGLVSLPPDLLCTQHIHIFPFLLQPGHLKPYSQTHMPTFPSLFASEHSFPLSSSSSSGFSSIVSTCVLLQSTPAMVVAVNPGLTHLVWKSFHIFDLENILHQMPLLPT